MEFTEFQLFMRIIAFFYYVAGEVQSVRTVVKTEPVFETHSKPQNKQTGKKNKNKVSDCQMWFGHMWIVYGIFY